MAQKFPYFRWYPADALTDDRYSSMSLEALGLYHRMLNLSWVNDGLPTDLDVLSRMLGISRRRLDKLWPTLSKCWDAADGKLRNFRLEREREHVRSRSAKASESVNARYERTTNDLPRAYASAVSVSKKLSPAEKTASRAATEGDWPATTWAITQRFEVDSRFVCQVIEAAFAALHKNGGQPSDLVDSVLAGIIRDAIKGKPRGEAGLLLHTVPEIIESRLLREKRRKAALEAAERRRGPEPASRSQEGLFLIEEKQS